MEIQMAHPSEQREKKQNSHYCENLVSGIFKDSLLKMLRCLPIHCSNGVKA